MVFVQPDIADVSLWWTFGGGTKVEIKRGENSKPSVSIYPPSQEEIKTGAASIVCLVEKYYPGDAKVEWKADNAVISSGVKDSEKIRDSDNTYSMSSTLNLSAQEFQNKDSYLCSVTHSTQSSPVIAEFKRSECSA